MPASFFIIYGFLTSGRMSKFIVLLFLFVCAGSTLAQTGANLVIVVKNHDTKLPIADATVAVVGTDIRSATDVAGRAELLNIPAGEHVVQVSSLGYGTVELKLVFPLADPLVLSPAAGGFFRYENADQSVVSKGFETNLRLGCGIAKAFVGYTFTDADARYLPGDQTLPFTPRHKINSAFVLEKHESFKTGLEVHHTGSQVLTSGTRSRSYTVVGLFGEKSFGKLSLFINAENITDVRQGKYSQVVFPPVTAPTFAEIYATTEGRVFNGGIKVRF